MTTITKLGKEWRISFYFEPFDYGSAAEGDTASNTTNLLHLTLSNNAEDSLEEEGDRILAINFQPNRGMIVAASIGNELNYVRNFSSYLPLLNKRTLVEVNQLRRGGRYIYRILVDEEEVHSVENENPQEFTNVSVYLSNPWLPSTIGEIRSFQVATNNGGTHTVSLLLFKQIKP